MSLQALGWAMGKASIIEPSQSKLPCQAVLFALANYADEWGIAFVGQETIAEDCANTDIKNIRTHIQRLDDANLIARFERRDRNGYRTSDTIVLAPLAGDRGQMRDANEEKRALEKHSAEACAVARTTQPTGQAHPVGDSESRAEPTGQPCPAYRATLPEPTGQPCPSNRKKNSKKNRKETAAAARETQTVPEELDQWQTQLALFLDCRNRLEQFAANADYRHTDLKNEEWLSAIKDLSATDAAWRRNCEDAFSDSRLRDKAWVTGMKSKRAVQRLVASVKAQQQQQPKSTSRPSAISELVGL
jgi:hypothetical protein